MIFTLMNFFDPLDYWIWHMQDNLLEGTDLLHKKEALYLKTK